MKILTRIGKELGALVQLILIVPGFILGALVGRLWFGIIGGFYWAQK